MIESGRMALCGESAVVADRAAVLHKNSKASKVGRATRMFVTVFLSEAEIIGQLDCTGKRRPLFVNRWTAEIESIKT